MAPPQTPHPQRRQLSVRVYQALNRIELEKQIIKPYAISLKFNHAPYTKKNKQQEIKVHSNKSLFLRGWRFMYAGTLT